MRISDWSSDVCSSDLRVPSEKPLSRDAESGQNRPGIGGEENERGERRTAIAPQHPAREPGAVRGDARVGPLRTGPAEVIPSRQRDPRDPAGFLPHRLFDLARKGAARHDPVACGSDRVDEARFKTIGRSEEHTSELQSLMRISYAVFCLKKKNINSKSQLISHIHTTDINNNNNVLVGTTT